MRRFRKKRLGDLLAAGGIIDEAQLQYALKKQRENGTKLGETLISLGYTNEEEIVQTLMEQLSIESVDLQEIKIPREVLRVVPEPSLLKKYTVIPFSFSENGLGLNLAMADPTNLMAIDDMAIVTGLQINPYITTTGSILAAIDRYFGDEETRAVAARYQKEREDEIAEENAANAQESADVQNSPIVQMVKTLIEQAVRRRSSDIHIEPMDEDVRIRNRVDGVLITVGEYPMTMFPAIVTRVKIMGGMDISEKRKPQDGRITQVVDKIEYDIRVSTLPTTYGEKIVMRLTAKNAVTRSKQELGMDQDEAELFDRMLANSNGIILVTGPTGSGKSTTLYTAISGLNREQVNIITVEDPVEANIDGINQVQVNPKADLTFANALRAILRQDPDIIMIGEIRDEETAGMAVSASITGHLVVSTLHTNNAATSVTRLMDMGIEPYLLADTVVGVIAQRLVRKLCDCKKCREATDTEKKMIGVPVDRKFEVYTPFGCVKCNDTGYLGRTGIYEMMSINNRIKGAIAAGKSADELEQMAMEDGMNTLRMSAARLVREGITSLDEMERITFTTDSDAVVPGDAGDMA